MKLISFFLTFFFCSILQAFELNQEVYLNACGGNPDTYFDQPINLNNKIIEAPNKITKLTKTEFGRDFHTESESVISINDLKITATLENFRFLKIFNNQDEKIYERKVSGATSIYEYKHNNKTIGWGVGWHKHCNKNYYLRTDFTVLRTLVPVMKDDSIQIEEVILKPNISEIFSAYSKSPYPIFSSSKNIYGYSKPYWCYYCGTEFLLIDNLNGIQILKLEDLDLFDINLDNISPLVSLNLLANIESKNPELQIKNYKKFILDNFQAFLKEAHENFYIFPNDDLFIGSYNSNNIFNAINKTKYYFNNESKFIRLQKYWKLIFDESKDDYNIIVYSSQFEDDYIIDSKSNFRKLFEFENNTIDGIEYDKEMKLILLSDNVSIFKDTAENQKKLKGEKFNAYELSTEIFSPKEVTRIYESLPEWLQEYFLSKSHRWSFDYNFINLNSMIDHYKKNCDLNVLETIDQISNICFPFYSSFIDKDL